MRIGNRPEPLDDGLPADFRKEGLERPEIDANRSADLGLRSDTMTT
jgi:hypothetical protein